MKVSSYQLTVIWFVAVAAFACRAELKVSLKPEAESLFVYEPFALILESNADIEITQTPSGGGLSVTGITAVPNKHTVRIELVPEEAGVLTFPPMEVRAGDETVKTPPFRLTISAPRRASEMNLSVTFSTTRLYIDQPAKMTVTWSSAVPFTRCQELIMDLPVLRNPDWEVYPLDPAVPEKQRIGLPVNNQRVIAKTTATETSSELSFSFMLIPRREGVTRPAEIRLACALMHNRRASSQYPSYFDNHFFNVPEKSDRFDRIYLSAPLPELTVLALPEAGRTVRYCGVAGGCSVEASVQPGDVVVGQPMMLTLELSRMAFGAAVEALPEAVLDDLGSEFQITPRPLNEQTTETSKRLTYVIRPLRSGITKIPAFALQFFDPEQHMYRTLRTKPLDIRVDPDGKHTVYQPHLSEDQKPKRPLSGIRGNRKESTSHMNTLWFVEFVARNAWLLWLLPPLIWLALRPWFRRRDRCRTDAAYARAIRAARNFRRAVRHDEETAWKTYLADRFNLHAEAVTFETVAPELEKHNLNPELIRSIRARFTRQDTTRYAPEGTPPNKASAAWELVAKIEKAARIILLLICLLPALDSDAAAPDELFRQAMQIRAEKPDEARPLFTEAALGFEAENDFLNAANGWFFAGENGRALANYLAAERRNPFDRQTHESIAFIRTQRADSFQTLDTPVSKISNAWKQFGRWSPSIRGALLTLLYLAGWTLFLTARFFGKRVSRRAWIIIGIAAAIPVLSLIGSAFQPLEGVVIQSTEARLGPGYAYDPAYETLLHEATEFQWLEKRNGWVRGRLPDNTAAWMTESACVEIK